MTQEDGRRDGTSGWAAPGGGQAEEGVPAPPSPGHGAPPPGGLPPHGGPTGYGPPGYGPPGQAPPGYGPPPPQPPKPGVVALRPLALGDILNGAFSYVRHNPKTTMGLALIVMAIASIVSSVGLGGYMADYGAFMRQAFEDPLAVDDDTMPFSAWSLIATYGGTLLTYAGQIVLTGLLTSVVGLAVLGRKLTMGQAWAAVRDRLGAIAGLALLVLLINIGVTAAAVGLVAVPVLVAFLMAAGGSPEGLVLVVGFFGVLAGVAAALSLWLWINIRLAFAVPPVVLERISPGAALARSWRLTRGSWWRCFLILLLTWFIVGLVSNILTVPFSVLAALPGVFAAGAAWVPVLSTAAMYVGTVLASALTVPFLVGVTTLLYVDLRMRREGLDLKLHAAAQSGAEPGPEIYLPEYRA